MKEKKEVWIIKGYEKFALCGESGLKVEQLAKEVGVSKSSFYHLFADFEIIEWSEENTIDSFDHSIFVVFYKDFFKLKCFCDICKFS